MRDLDFNPNNLPKDVLEALGLITACSAHSDYVIESGIAGCLGVNIEYGSAVTTHMTTPHRKDVFLAAAELRIDDVHILIHLEDLLDELVDALKVRNGYVHNSPAIDRSTNETFMIRTEARGSVDVSLIPLSVEVILRDAQRIYKAGISLYGLLDKLGLLPKIPDGVRPNRTHKDKAARKKIRKSRRDRG
ncbi:hypothetical protein [Nitrobacter winogradskyi]|nr:hypothetical protein [Nitrobacter winogradskyi]